MLLAFDLKSEDYNGISFQAFADKISILEQFSESSELDGVFYVEFIDGTIKSSLFCLLTMHNKIYTPTLHCTQNHEIMKSHKKFAKSNLKRIKSLVRSNYIVLEG